MDYTLTLVSAPLDIVQVLRENGIALIAMSEQGHVKRQNKQKRHGTTQWGCWRWKDDTARSGTDVRSGGKANLWHNIKQ